MARIKEKPKWWPLCPYPEDIFTMERSVAIDLLPTDPMTKTAVAGCLGRIFWEIASDTILDRLREYLEDNADKSDL